MKYGMNYMNIEYRAYYDDNGKIINYTTENLVGNYIVITAHEYACARFDCIVVKGKLQQIKFKKQLSKFKKSNNGIKCNSYDINIIQQDYDCDYNCWELVTYEIQ